jgi:hypothetical protein
MKISNVFVILMFFISLSNCSKRLDYEQNVENGKQESGKMFQTANQDNLIGKWQTYESKHGYGKKICEGKPCGDTGYMEISFIDKKVIGRTFLAVSSELEPPNNVKWAELSIEFVNDNVNISFVSSAGCRVKYVVTEVEDNKLFGSYESKSCKFNGKLFDFEGDFSAVKITDEAK